MRRPIAAFTVLLCLTPGILRAESFNVPDDASLSLNDEAFVLEFEERDPPVATGPGFKYFGRVMLGSTVLTNGSTVYQAFGDSIAEFGSIEQFTFRYDTLETKKLRNLHSIELMGQHLWDESSGLLNYRPAMRVGFYSQGIAVDAGSLPTAELSPLVSLEKEKSNDWWEGFKHNNYFSYGLRYNNGYDGTYFTGISDVIGQVYSNTEVQHQVLGPQVAIGRVVSKQRWSLDVSGALLMGYGRTGFEQQNGFHDDATPGGLNNLFFTQPTYSRYTKREEHFAAHAELRAVNSYLIKANWSVDLVARAFVAGPWRQSSQVVEYNLVDMGIGEAKKEYLGGANLALSLTYLR